MPCYITENNETNVPAYNIWTSENFQTPHVLKSILYPNDLVSTDDMYKFDSTSSQKRKLLECDREDIEERLRKIQRKKQLHKSAARASLVVENDSDDSDEEERMYKQMDWIEKQSAFPLASYDTGNDSSFDDKDNTSVLLLPRSKWKDERRLLLRISMAKIYNVEDPEAYLRRSVLINNTVRRLQNDIPINHQCHSTATSTSYTQENVFQNDSMDSWDAKVVCSQETDSDTFAFSYQYESLQNSHVVDVNSPVVYKDMPCSLNFHLASLSSDKVTLEAIQHQILQNGSVLYDRNSLGHQTLNDASLSLVLKQPSPRSFPSQSCSLQCYNPI